MIPSIPSIPSTPSTPLIPSIRLTGRGRPLNQHAECAIGRCLWSRHQGLSAHAQQQQAFLDGLANHAGLLTQGRQLIGELDSALEPLYTLYDDLAERLELTPKQRNDF